MLVVVVITAEMRMMGTVALMPLVLEVVVTLVVVVVLIIVILLKGEMRE